MIMAARVATRVKECSFTDEKLASSNEPRKKSLHYTPISSTGKGDSL